MSVWGGIGEGLTAGMNNRIALEMQRRKEAREQANADREFQFKQQQADAAQANADRAFKAGREDAANAQENATADRALRQQALDEQSNTNLRNLELSEARFGEEQYQHDIDNAVKEREIALKEEAQSFENRMNDERTRSFQLANDKLDREERQAQELDDARKASGRQQMALAIYRVTGLGGKEQTITLKDEKGNDVQKVVRVLPQSSREQIFGKDGYFKDVQNVISFEDENGKTVAAFVKPDGTMQVFNQDDIHSIYSSGFGTKFADEQLAGVAAKRDLGMFTAKEEAKANAKIREDMAKPTGDSAFNSLLQTGVREGLFDDETSKEIADYAIGLMRRKQTMMGSGTRGGGEWAGFSAEKRAALERLGYRWDAATGKPVKGKQKKRIEFPKK